MPLTTGARLGPYTIQSPLGAGGMGEVYRARDPRLGRDVAIKVLPASLSADADRLRRFEQEARAAAALNHPNIVAVFDIGLQDCAPFIVMELLEGQTLRERLRDGALPMRKAVEYAAQIAHGLAAAHEKGIVHRDLKPENVFVTGEGRVKILDFGLAKLTETAPAPADVSAAPTVLPTSAGMVLGTVGYMAPEQVRGEAADYRADIFALGCMLYEMAVGRRAFVAPTTAETMTAILKNDPPELPSDCVPPGLARVILRCLEKSQAARFKSADDLAFALEALSSAQVSATSAVTRHDARTARRNPGIVWVVAGITVAAVVAVMLRLFEIEGEPSNPAGATRVELTLPAGVELWSLHGAIAVSADGRRVAFIGVRSGVRQVYVRRLDQFDATSLRGTEGATTCFFAPDGESIGFTNASAALVKVSLIDGSVTVLTDDADYTFPGTWGTDDRITFTRNGELWQVPASGGVAIQLATREASRQEVLHGFPVAVGNGRVVFASAGFGSTSRIEALMGDAGRRVLIDTPGFPIVAAGGRLVFFRDGALFVAPLDVERLEVTGTPARIAENVAIDGIGTPVAAVSAAGTLVYQSSDSAAGELVWVSRDGRAMPVGEPQRPYGHPRVSPDGRRLLVDASGDIWMLDTTRSTFTRLMSDQPAAATSRANTFPLWTPDGTRVVFRTRTNLRWVNADGSGRPQDIPGTLASDFPSSVSPDGKLLAFARLSSGTSLDVYLASFNGNDEPRPVVKTTANEGGPQFSPDGRWLAYVSSDTGQFQIYLRSLAGPERRWQVSTDGGTSPLWSRNGRELFYRNGDRMMAVDVSPGTEPVLSRPRTLFEQRYAYGTTVTLPNYAVQPDGQGFLMVRELAQTARLNVVMNWFSELVRLAPDAGR